jgi:cystathionine beta-lyase
MFLESPNSISFELQDIAACVKIAKEYNLVTVCDNSYSSPLFQNPIAMGVDIVTHSGTKYINGHSDVVMGVLCTSSDELRDRLAFIQNSCGATPGPMDCFLTLRGIKTLHIRMQRHCENGAKVAHWLKSHPKVGEVYWPGFESHPNHAVAKEQMKDFGGMISFTLKDDAIEKALTFLKSTQLFALAESLGGVESLVGHPATMTHASIPKAEREANGLKDSLIRLSVGIEHVDDLIADLEGALAKV